MSSFTPLVLPLNGGLDQSKDPLAGEGLTTAFNIDYSKAGLVVGRPSRSTPKNVEEMDFGYRADTAPTMVSAASWGALQRTYQQAGLVSLRTANAETPALASQGRIFVEHGTTWVDHGAFGCFKHDQVGFARSPASTARYPITSDFGVAAKLSTTAFTHGLLDSNRMQERTVAAGSNRVKFPGTGARCGTTTAIVSVDASNNLYFTYRANGGSTLTEVLLASDAANPADDGDAPVICCSHDQTVFYVAYATTTANTVKVLRVTTTGTVTHTATSSGWSSLAGHWVDNSDVATGKVCLAVTDASGVTFVFLSATDLTSGGSNINYQESSYAGRQVVCGWMGGDENGALYFGLTSYRGASYANNMAIGVVVLGDAAYLSRNHVGGITTNGAYVRWGLVHQPVWVGSRCYMTVKAGYGSTNTSTWMTLDLTNWYNSAGLTGPHPSPTVVAAGKSLQTADNSQPASAIPMSTDDGWDFPTIDFLELELTPSQDVSGSTTIHQLNRLQYTSTTAVQVNDMTVFSGSVPRFVAGGGRCWELGWPFLGGQPGSDSGNNTSGAGTLTSGDYATVACWVWEDESGTTHRSAPSVSTTCTVTTAPAGGDDSVLVAVTNPWMSEKYTSGYLAISPRIEVYIAGPNPAAGDPYYLASTTTPNYTEGCTFVTVNSAPTNTTILYTDGGVYGNYPVSADGGMAALGRRLWSAGARKVYASTYLAPGESPHFNDEGGLEVNLPAGAGRVLALSPMDDKLIIFCSRGIYALPDGGPDNTGVGADLAQPYRVSDLGIAGPRAACLTDAGVVFCTDLDTTEPMRGGPWLLDRSLNLQYIGRPLGAYLDSSGWEPECFYSQERQQTYITVPFIEPSKPGIAVYDHRTQRWAMWAHQSVFSDGDPGALETICVANGVVWSLSDELAAYSGAPGTDLDAGGDYLMLLRTAHMPANGQDAGGWARVRSVSVLPGANQGAHTLGVGAKLDSDDDAIDSSDTDSPFNLTAQTTTLTWPTDRFDAEYRLPTQKCATIQVTLYATPANAKWNGIRLDVAPLPGRAPAYRRQ